MTTVLARRSSRRRAYGIKAAVSIEGCTTVFLQNGWACDYESSDPNSKFAGVSVHPVDNSDGADGEQLIDIEHEEFFFLNAGDIDQTHIGSKAYFSASNTLSISHNTNTRPAAGTITQLEDSGVWVLPEVQ